MQDKLDGVTAQSFNQMLTQKINENTGGTYSQKAAGSFMCLCVGTQPCSGLAAVQVIAFEQDTAGEGSVSRAHLCSVTLGFRRETFADCSFFCQAHASKGRRHLARGLKPSS